MAGSSLISSPDSVSSSPSAAGAEAAVLSAGISGAGASAPGGDQTEKGAGEKEEKSDRNAGCVRSGGCSASGSCYLRYLDADETGKRGGIRISPGVGEPNGRAG